MSNKPNIKPLVSIIIPFYNVEKYLSQCLDSIINQTYKNLEIILINDGSSDKSGSIAKEYENLDKRIKVFEQKNMGAGATRNAGFVKSSGEYVLFFDSDDWLHSCDAIELLITRALQTHADIIIAQSRAYRDKDKNFEDMPHSLRMDLLPQKEAFNYTDFPKYIFNFCVGWAWDKLYKRDFIENHKIAFSEVASTNDLYFVFLSLFFANRISIVPQILFIKRIQLLHSIGATLYKNPLLFFEETMKLKKALLTGGGGGYSLVSQSFTNFALDFCLWHLSVNQDDKSQKIIYKAINKYIAKDLGLNDVDSDYIYNLMNYKCLQIILKYSYKDYKQLMQNSACNIIQNKLEYRLGNALMKAKNPFKLLKLPFTLIRLIRKYRFERKVYKAMITFRPELQLKPLEQYPDYEEALKIKGKLFYKLGEAFVQNPFSFLFKCYRICKSFKNKTIN